MKKLLYFVFAVISAIVFSLSGCYTQGSSQNHTFALSTTKPWKNYHEKLTYKYEQTAPSGDLLESGNYAVEITVSGDSTEIKSTLTIDQEDGTQFEALSSAVTMDSASLFPKRSEKKITDKEGKNGYEIIMDYENGTSRFKYDADETERKTISIPQIGQDTFDNEQFYWIIRCASNLTDSDNNGTFSMINGVDSYILGSLKTYTMQYTVGESTNVACTELAGMFGIGSDGRIPCKTVTGAIADSRTGSKTTLYYAVNAFESGGDKVLVKFERPKYSLSTLQTESISTFTLVSYSAL